jgi:nucleoside-diphosphate-sugar epimerase
MKVVVTGGAGFLGQLLIRTLCERGKLTRSDGTETRITRILSIDQTQTGKLFVDDRVEYAAGDISSSGFLARSLSRDTDSVFHLAAVVSGGAEADFDLGMRVNIDATRALLDACREQHGRPRLVFTSSVAAFGVPLPDVVTDATTPTPRSSYGVQKLIGELLVGDYSRKGYIDGRSVRLPTVVVRPGKPNAAASSFASGIIREPLAGVEALCPVDAETALWITSPRAAVAAFIHAHETPESEWEMVRALNLPGLTTSVREMVEALRAVGGDAAAARVRMQPDARIRAIVETWPARFRTARADALGFKAESDIVAIVREYAREYA